MRENEEKKWAEQTRGSETLAMTLVLFTAKIDDIGLFQKLEALPP